jgi:hypothetical protein
LDEYVAEYEDVISIMSIICSKVVWNNNPANKDRRMKIDEQLITDLAPRIWELAKDYES